MLDHYASIEQNTVMVDNPSIEANDSTKGNSRVSSVEDILASAVSNHHE